MFVLFLDDNIERHNAAESAFSAFAGSCHTLLHAYNEKDVMEIVAGCQEKIGLAMFDHDLDDGEPNGSFIAGNLLLTFGADKWPARVIVHSNNCEGAQNIISKFKSVDVFCEYKPFGIGAGYWGDLIESLKEE